MLGGSLLLAPGFITRLRWVRAADSPPGRVPAVVSRLAKRRVAFAGQSPARTPIRRPRPRGYDYEGTAHEVNDPTPEIGRVIAMADALTLRVPAPTGDTLRFDWEPGRSTRLTCPPGAEPPWTFGGESTGTSSTLCACCRPPGDGRVLAIAALRPAGATATVTSWSPGRSATPTRSRSLAEPLLSTEYGPDGARGGSASSSTSPTDGPALRIAGE